MFKYIAEVTEIHQRNTSCLERKHNTLYCSLFEYILTRYFFSYHPL